MMTGHLEPVASILRVFPFGKHYGDEYTWCATVRYIDCETVEICGVLRSPTPDEWRTISHTLACAGVTSAIVKRVHNGVVEQKRFLSKLRR